MQGNGLRIFITVAFLVLCGYYLYPSVQNYFITQKLESLEGEARQEYLEAEGAYIDEVRQASLSLGLDLRGGMHVTLEVQTAQLLRALADDVDETFDEALQAARERVEETGESVVEAFVEEFEARNPEGRLSRYFRDQTAGITRASSNADVAGYLRQEADEAVDRAVEIIRNRINRFGVTEPSIQKVGQQRITVALPGVEDEERVRNLLRGTARLEFRLMADPEQLARSVQRIVEYYEPTAADTTAAGTTIAEVDTTAAADTTDATGTLITGEPDTPEAEVLETPAGPVNPLLEVLRPLPYPEGVAFGRVLESDTTRVNELLSRPEVQALLPPGVELLYMANPVGVTEGGEAVFDLLAAHAQTELTGEVVTDASVTFDQMNRPEVSISMDSEGARIWSRLTGANVGRPVSIVLDGVIYSNAVIQERIPGGRTSISGLGSRAEAQDIVTVLKSGALPAPLEIIGERTVGPSLGEASIQAGLTSVLVGLLLVALFMIMYYRTGGVVADIALLVNLILLLGILAGFNATLTLPGIAGIVLTIGMAVDANVLIFERIREELDAGKTLKAAIDAGYANALSAIMDGQITTFFVGVILFSFGVGPIKGFAVTLMAGILTSLFTSIIVTRILFDYLVKERGMTVSYG